jgi:ribosomal protein L37AE/L43A
MPHVIERATSGRATCRGCGQRVAAGAPRFGEALPNPYAEGDAEMRHWYHLPCAAYRRPEPLLEAEVIEDRERLSRDATVSAAHRRLPRISTAERASSGRAACRACRETIDKGAWRIALVYYEDGRFSASGFVHVRCAPSYFETSEVIDRIRHFSPALGEADVQEILKALSV